MDGIQVAVVGCGYWGPNLIRHFTENKRSSVKYVVDLNPDRFSSLARRYPHTQFISDLEICLNDSDVAAVVIATPVRTHFPLASHALKAGKHVMIEKPMCMTSAECTELIALAAEQKKTLMVGHTFVYNGAVNRIKQSIDRGELGDILYFDSVRVNLGLIQEDVNVIYDLAPHDLSIMDYLIGKNPTSVQATGANLVGSNFEELAHITLNFEDRFIANFHLSWLSPVKVRRILIGGTSKMIVYDDLEAFEKIKIYDKGVVIREKDTDIETKRNAMINYRLGDLHVPAFDTSESLKGEVEHFVDCALTGRRPITDGEAGLRVVRMLELANVSLANKTVEKMDLLAMATR